MRVHHLNCVSACPVGGLLMDGATRGSLRGKLVNHCLLVETNEGLVLVDTGYGLRDVANPRSRLSPLFRWLLAPALREEMTAIRQIQRLGFRAHDVRHIVLSHLDFDHAGGLDDFPDATVHLLRDEIVAATDQRTVLDRMRYRPEQWGSRDRWRAYEAEEGCSWFGFGRVRELSGLDGDVALVPLVGHTLGHAGVAIHLDTGWLFYVGDAYFHHDEMNVAKPHAPPGLALYQTVMEKNRALRLENQRRLRELCRDHGSEITVFCGHDVRELESFTGRAHEVPVEAPRVDEAAERRLHEESASLSEDERIDQNGFDSFPASDAPSWSPTVANGPRH